MDRHCSWERALFPGSSRLISFGVVTLQGQQARLSWCSLGHHSVVLYVSLVMPGEVWQGLGVGGGGRWDTEIPGPMPRPTLLSPE